MGKLKKALAKAKAQRGPRKVIDNIDPIDNSPQVVSQASVTAKEDLTESIRNINPILGKREDISHHQLNRETADIRENLKESVIDKNEITKKMDIFRTEHSKSSFKKEKDYLFTLFKPTSFISDNFRIIRTLLFTLIKKKNVKTILVTSPLPMEGKTFVASNIAVSLAYGLDQNVLLVDADLRKPSLQDIFKISMENGLSDLLLDRNNKLRNLIQKTNIPKLSILPAGINNEHSAELLSSEVMNIWMWEMKKRYDNLYIIFDAPPAQLSEALVLSNIVDGIILVVRAGKTDKKLVKNTVELLGRQKILGVILNHCQLKTKPYYEYYKKYEYSHGMCD